MEKMEYLWRIASECPDHLIVLHQKGQVAPALLRTGAPVENPGIQRFLHGGRVADFVGQSYIPNSSSAPLVSEEAGWELAKLLGEAIQMIPARVSCTDGELDAMLVNPLRVVTAVDWNESEAVLIPGTRQVMRFNRLRLDDHAIQGHLARLEEYRSFLLASESVRSLFASCALCEFVPASAVRR